MIVKKIKFAEIPDGAIQSILSDDEFVNHAFFDNAGYLHICQSKKGNRQIEIELAPVEANRLFKMMQRVRHW